jgi:hypothetical protein
VFDNLTEMTMTLFKLPCLLSLSVALTFGMQCARAAEAAVSPAESASAAKLAAKPAGSATTKVPAGGKVATPATGSVGKAGDNQYPGTTPLPPKPPRKDALEAAGAIKAKAGQ